MDPTILNLYDTFNKAAYDSWGQRKFIKRRKADQKPEGWEKWQELMQWLNTMELTPSAYFHALFQYMKSKGLTLRSKSVSWFASETAREIGNRWHKKLANRDVHGNAAMSPYNTLIQNIQEEVRGSVMLLSDVRLGAHPLDRRLAVLQHISPVFWAVDPWFLCPPIQASLSREMKDYVARLQLWLRDHPHIQSYVIEAFNESTTGCAT